MNSIHLLDAKNIKILHELDENCRQSNSEIGKKLRLSKEAVRYRIDAMLKSGIIFGFHTVINYFKLGLVKYKIYIRLKNVDMKQSEKIAQYFKNNKKTEWVVTCTGKWDMIIGFIVHNIDELYEEIQNMMDKFSNNIDEKSVTTTLYLAHHTRNFLVSTHNKYERKNIIYYTTADKHEDIEDIDTEILKIMANNARISVRQIARMLKTSSRIIQYHIKKLEEKKIILAYKVHLDPLKMGNVFCKAMFYLRSSTKERLNAFFAYCSSLRDVVWPQRVIGAWDFELDFEIEDYTSFQNVIFDIKEKFSDIIRDYDFIIVSKEYKLDLFMECYPKIT